MGSAAVGLWLLVAFGAAVVVGVAVGWVRRSWAAALGRLSWWGR